MISIVDGPDRRGLGREKQEKRKETGAVAWSLAFVLLVSGAVDLT
jgi:hypothetical protein